LAVLLFMTGEHCRIRFVALQQGNRATNAHFRDRGSRFASSPRSVISRLAEAIYRPPTTRMQRGKTCFSGVSRYGDSHGNEDLQR
jgi:hypothetical protein